MSLLRMPSKKLVSPAGSGEAVPDVSGLVAITFHTIIYFLTPGSCLTFLGSLFPRAWEKAEAEPHVPSVPASPALCCKQNTM